jgi:hypothetical protein
MAVSRESRVITEDRMRVQRHWRRWRECALKTKKYKFKNKMPVTVTGSREKELFCEVSGTVECLEGEGQQSQRKLAVPGPKAVTWIDGVKGAKGEQPRPEGAVRRLPLKLQPCV